MTGEAGLSRASEEIGKTWILWVFMIGGALTSGAVLRVGLTLFWRAQNRLRTRPPKGGTPRDCR